MDEIVVWPSIYQLFCGSLAARVKWPSRPNCPVAVESFRADSVAFITSTTCWSKSRNPLGYPRQFWENHGKIHYRSILVYPQNLGNNWITNFHSPTMVPWFCYNIELWITMNLCIVHDPGATPSPLRIAKHRPSAWKYFPWCFSHFYQCQGGSDIESSITGLCWLVVQ